MFSKDSTQHCQSKYYKQWHPDYISAYNSLTDKHLKHYFRHPARQQHLNKNNQVGPGGQPVTEREWRRQNLEWERQRRDADERAERLHQRDVDERRARMELRQRHKDEDQMRKRQERNESENFAKDPTRAVKEAWVDQASLLSRISAANRSDVEHLLNFLNFEIEYILRPRSAPIRYRGPPRLRTDRRAQSARRGGASSVTSARPGYPAVRTKSLERHLARSPLIPDDSQWFVEAREEAERDLQQQLQANHVDYRPYDRIRNIEVPERGLSPDARTRNEYPRPATAPPRVQRRHRRNRVRSPTRPNYKEEEYQLCLVRLQYAGHPDHSYREESRARYRAHRKRKRLPAIPMHMDEVTIVQQPRGSYVLEVYHGFLAIGDEFQFTSRRVCGYPFSLTIFVNRQCHVRLSTCCESKRTVGSRLGQGFFQVVSLQGAIPCIRCMIEKDPVAQKHAAKIRRLRGTYDRYGNRKAPSQQAEEAKATTTAIKKKAKDTEDSLASDDEVRKPKKGYSPRPRTKPRYPGKSPSSVRVSGVSGSRVTSSRPVTATASKRASSGPSLSVPARKERPKSAPKYHRSQEPSSPLVSSHAVEYSESSEDDVPLPEDVAGQESSEDEDDSVEEEDEDDEDEDSDEVSEVDEEQINDAKPTKAKPVKKVRVADARVKLDASSERQKQPGPQADEDVDHALQDDKSSDGEDTVDEAPSIEDDEVQRASSSKSSESSESSSDSESDSESSQESQVTSSHKWETAENVVSMVSADIKLKDAKKEGDEISQELVETATKQKREEEEEQKRKEEEQAKPEQASQWKSKMSHFRAMQLLGMLFRGVKPKLEEDPTSTTESRTIEDDDGSESEFDSTVDEGTEQMTKDEPEKEPQKELSLAPTITVEQDEEEVETSVSSEPTTENADKAGIATLQVPDFNPDGDEDVLTHHEDIDQEGEEKEAGKSDEEESEEEEDDEAEDEEEDESDGGDDEDEESVSSDDDEEAVAQADQEDQSPPEGEDAKPKVPKISHFQALILLKRLFNNARSKPAKAAETSSSYSSSKTATGGDLDQSKSLSESTVKGQASSISSSESSEEDDSESGPHTQSQGEEGEDSAKPSPHSQETVVAEVHMEQCDDDVFEPEAKATAIEEQDDEHTEDTEEDSSSSSEEEDSEEESSKAELYDDDVIEATTKIQAGYRGYKARKEVKELKNSPRTEELSDDDEEESEEEDSSEEEEEEEEEEGEEVLEATTKIQAGYRGYKDRKRVQKLKDERLEATTKIQAGYRGYKARKRVKNLKTSQRDEEESSEEESEEDSSSEEEEDEENEDIVQATTKIQAGYRGYKARRRVNEMKNSPREENSSEEDDEESEEESEEEESSSEEEEEDEEGEDVLEAATKIQAGYRGYKDRRRVKQLKNQEAEATTKIQAGYRGYKARKRVKEMKESSRDAKVGAKPEDGNDEAVIEATTKIQAGYRGYKARKRVKGMKRRQSEEEEEEEESSEEEETEEESSSEEESEEEEEVDAEDKDVVEATTKIQAGYRGYKARKRVNQLKNSPREEESEEEEDSDEEESSSEEEEEEEEEEDVLEAATKIQAGYRGYKDRRRVKQLKSEQAEATTKIQAGYRGYKARKRVKQIKSDKEVEATTKLQAGYRGYKARREVKDMKRKRRQSGANRAEDDEEVIRATTTIQAGYRGHKARKRVKTMKKKRPLESEFDIDPNDSQVQEATTKIQAGFRGQQARRKVKAMKDAKDPSEEGSEEGSEEIDIDLADPKVAAATSKIQAGFRGHQARKEVQRMRNAATEEASPEESATTSEESEEENEASEEVDIDLNDPDVAAATTKIQAGFRGHQARMEVEKMKESAQAKSSDGDETESEESSEEESADSESEEVDIDLNDPDVAAATTKIQASFRGHQARKEVQKIRDDAQSNANNNNTEEVDVDLNDPEVAAATTKIQAGFRGHQARKEVERMKEQGDKAEEEEEPEGEGEEEIDIDLNDPEVAAATTKIQAGFRGHQARKEVGKLKESAQTKQADEGGSQSEESDSSGSSSEEEEEESEEIDIDLNDPDVAAATTKIQAGFRGHQARKEVQKLRDAGDKEDSDEERGRTSSTTVTDIIGDAVHEEEGPFLGKHSVNSMSTTDETASRLNSFNTAATNESDTSRTITDIIANAVDDELQIENEITAVLVTDIDLADPEIEEATVKIQAGFRGLQARKEVDALKEQRQSPRRPSSATEDDSGVKADQRPSVANVDSANEYSSESEEESSSSSESAASATAESSIVAKNALLDEEGNAFQDNDSGTSMSSQNTPRLGSAKSLSEPESTNQVIVVAPKESQEEESGKEKTEEKAEEEVEKEVSESSSLAPSSDEPESPASSSFSDSTSSSVLRTNSALRSKYSTFTTLKRLVQLMGVNVVGRKHKVAVEPPKAQVFQRRKTLSSEGDTSASSTTKEDESGSVVESMEDDDDDEDDATQTSSGSSSKS